MKKIILVTYMISIALIAAAQESTCQCPKHEEVSWESLEIEDYLRYQNTVLECIDWLMKTPIKVQQENRKKASGFIMAWLLGCPYVHLSLYPFFMEFTEKNRELIIIFIAGCIKYGIENDVNREKQFEMQKAGLMSLVNYYKQRSSMGLKRDKYIEKFIESYLDDNDKLNSWLRKQIGR